ncbi:putative leucine-rich repeat receptor-like protein kinase [Planoprotostelium fungivorum]|uniref:Putative leucine-rich repeat receptor-like protein kinase n=1 Tax=Planoprotostelium fungivorum TaxID=1890364 RepID=A0A2P6N4Y8_9EUKA|nr:putative leucine-rich repeat receptor-like protein kinase [Planoprotostelium fungivorum]
MRSLILVYLVTLFYHVTAISVASPDQSALLDFRATLGNPPPSWTGSTASCQNVSSGWLGVICDANNRVSSLILQNTNSNGNFPSSFTSMTALSTLALSSNYLSGTVPDLSPLSKLVEVYLGRNAFTGAIPNLPSTIKYADFSNNCFTSIATSINLPSLLQLTVQNNSITGLIPDGLSASSSLVTLNLNGNQFNGNIPLLPASLTFLGLGGNSLTSLPNLNQLTNLTYFNFSGNSFVTSLPSRLPPSLISLDLTNSGFSGNLSSGFSFLPNLTSLLLGGNQIVGTVPDWFSNVSFVALALDGNQLSGNLPVINGSLLTLCRLAQSTSSVGFTCSTNIPNICVGTQAASVCLVSQIEASALSDARISLGVSTSMWPGSIVCYSNGSSSWTGVKCDPTIGSITQISIGTWGITGTFPASMSSLTRLFWIYAPDNSISGSIPDNLSTKMVYLHLANNRLNGSMPTWISNCASMALLNVKGNSMGGNLPNIVAMPQIGLFDVSGNNLSGYVPSDVSSLTSLQYYDVSNNNIAGTFPIFPTSIQYIGMSRTSLNGAMYSLTSYINLISLSLQGCGLSGTIPSLPITLQRIDLSGNQFTGSFPNSLSAMSSLTYLNLSGNTLSGLPSSLPTSLVYLDLTNMSLTDAFPFYIGNLNNLNTLLLSGNQLTGVLPSALGNQLYGTLPALNPYTLTTCLLAQNTTDVGFYCTAQLPYVCSGTQLISICRIPSSETSALLNLRSSLGISTSFWPSSPQCYTNTSTSWPGVRCLATWGNMYSMTVSSMGLSGRFHPSMSSFSKLAYLNAAYNNLQGPIPDNLSTGITYLNLNGNQMNGTIPSFLSQCLSLSILDLAGGNQFQGNLPNLTAMTQLTLLDLSYNNFSSNLPSLITLTSITKIDLSYNNITGTLPSSLTMLTSLTYLDLSRNRLSGAMPVLLPKLQFIGLSFNSLSGALYDLSSFSGLITLRLAGTGLTGTIPGLPASIQELNLGFGSFSSTSLPPSLAGMITLISLNLSGNRFSGPLPSSLSIYLNTIDFTNCGLNGTIPSYMGKMNFLKTFRVAGNNLTGSVPSNFGFLSFASFNIAGNQLSGILPTIKSTSLVECQLAQSTINKGFTCTTVLPNVCTAGTITNLCVIPDAEMSALMDLKTSLSVSSWSGSPICQMNGNTGWTGVSCLPIGSISSIIIVNQLRTGSLPSSMSALSQLITLNLYGNQINGTLPSGMSNNLQTLILSGNRMTGSLPYFVSLCYQMIDLELRGNSFSGSLPILVAMPNLQIADLKGCRFSGSIPSDLSTLTSLQYLDLSSSVLVGSFPLLSPSITYIDLTGSSLSGSLYSMSAFSSLTTLRLLGNSLSGVIPALPSSITYLDFTNNYFSGPFPLSITSMSSLSYLSLSGITINSSIPSNLPSSLLTLDLSKTKLTGAFPSWLPTTLPNLTYLSLANNFLSGSLPSSLSNLALTNIDIGGNLLSGILPLINSSRLSVCNLVQNTVAVGFYCDSLPPSICTGTQVTNLCIIPSAEVSALLDIRSNISVPTIVWSGTPVCYRTGTTSWNGVLCLSSGNIWKVSIGSYNLRGSLPATMSSLSKMTYFYAGSNSISGPLPSNLTTGIVYFNINANKMNGTLPQWISLCQNMAILNLGHNQFTGPIPDLSGWTQLQQLDLSYNSLSGSFPSDFTTFTSLSYLDLSYNQLTGSYPTISTAMVHLDLSGLVLTGSLYNMLGFTNLTFLQLQGCGLGGTINRLPETLRVLNLGGNQFTGPFSGIDVASMTQLTQFNLSGSVMDSLFPTNLSSSLVSLDLTNCSFTSEGFPSVVLNLTNLFQLYLGGNNISGGIPQSITNLAKLGRFHVENNPLMGGNIPNMKSMSTIYDCLIGPGYLCINGSYLPASCTTPGSELACIIVNDQTTALVDVRNALNISDWVGLPVCGKDLSVTGWSGASCDSAGNIVSINLANRNLSGMLSKLTYLNLYNNSISGPFPGISTMDQLTYLDLSYNLFSGPLPSSFSTNPALTNIVLSHNDLNETLPSDISNLLYLSQLDLSYNQFTGPLPSNWSSTSLATWNLGSNFFNGSLPILPPSIFQMNVSHNNMSGTLSNLATLVALSRLDIVWNIHFSVLNIGNNQLGGTLPYINTDRLDECSLPQKTQAKGFYCTGSVPSACSPGGSINTCIIPLLQYTALLDLRASLNVPTPLWSNDPVCFTNSSTSWKEIGIQCDPTGAIVYITLDGMGLLNGSLPLSMSQLESLQYLYASGNNITGSIPQNMSTSIVFFYLYNNQLTGSLPSWLSQCNGMVYLSLGGGNRLTGVIPDISNMINLEQLDLSGNSLSGVIPSDLTALKSLRVLNLNHNNISGTFPALYPANLQYVDFIGSSLTGTLYDTSSYQNLTTLLLNGNKMNGPLPVLSASLQQLDLGGNRFTGAVPSSLASVGSLQFLNLSGNILTGPLPSSLASSLTVLDVTNNMMIGTIPSYLGSLSNLNQLLLGGNLFNGSLPASLADLKLNAFVITNNLLTGYIPLMNDHRMATCSIAQNTIDIGFLCTSPLPMACRGPLNGLNLCILPPSENSALLDLKANFQVSDTYWAVPPLCYGNGSTSFQSVSCSLTGSITVIDMTYLKSQGTFSPSMSAFQQLFRLSGDGNTIVGGLPDGMSTQFTFLSLPSTGMSGPLPSWLSSCSNMALLNLAGNSFTGNLPNLTAMAPAALILLNNNKLNGSIPDLHGSTSLTKLDLSNNFLSGTFPPLPNSLTYLDLSGNNVSGPLYSMSAFNSLIWLNLHQNSMNGDIPTLPSSLQRLDLGGNHFTSSVFPSSIAMMNHLTYLSLSGAHIPAPFPAFLPLPLNFLDLTNGSLYSPSFPQVISNLTALQQLYLGGNNISGQIPFWLTTLSELNTFHAENTQLGGSFPNLNSLSIRDCYLTPGYVEIPPPCGTSICITSETETQAMNELRIALNITKWTGSPVCLTSSYMPGWSGVRCGSTQHVTYIDLSYLGLSGQIPASLRDLVYLQYLNLEGNNIEGAFPDVSTMLQLAFLNLNYNHLNGSIPEEISPLSNLQILWAAGNAFTGRVPAAVTKLSSIQRIDLSDNQLSGPLSADWTSCTALSYLILNNNEINGSFPHLPPSLLQIDLSNNNMTGALPNFTMVSLSVLDVSNNKFHSKLPSLPHNLTKLILCPNHVEGAWSSDLSSMIYLQHISLNSCGMSGAINGIEQLTSLVTLDLSNNNFTSTVLAKLSSPSLNHLDLRFNQFNDDISTIASLPPGVTFLGLSNNNFSGVIPSNVVQFKQATNFYMSNMPAITGQLPTGFNLWSNLMEFDVSNNSINGSLPSFGGNYGLQVLDIGLNQLSSGIDFPLIVSGHLQRCRLWPQKSDMAYSCKNDVPFACLNPGQCSVFSGDVSAALFDLRKTFSISQWSGAPSCDWAQISCNIVGQIERIDLSSLGIAVKNAQIPSTIGGLGSTLTYLNMAGLSLSGPIPSSLWALNGLQYLNLQDNGLIGSPTGLGSLLDLRYLNLGSNLLSGQWPYSITLLTKLIYLDASSNSFVGSLPDLFGNMNSLTIFQLSKTGSLSGPLPASVKMLSQLQVLNIAQCGLSGPIPAGVPAGNSLMTVDMSNNAFVGNVPDFTAHRGLESISLRGNTFTGSLTSGYNGMVNLTTVDLSNNRLSGILPTLDNCPSLLTMDLSDNTFTGAIPVGYGSSLPSLRYLDLLMHLRFIRLTFSRSFNQLTGTTLQGTKGITTSLETLLLNNNNLTLVGYMLGFTMLKQLDLSSNKLSGSIGDLRDLNLTRCVLHSQITTTTRLLCDYPLPPVCISTLLCAIPSTQSNALQSLGGLINTPSYWTSTPSCSWNGIGCDTQGRVTSIQLNRVDLSNRAFPAQLSNIDTLQTLVINGCNLTGTISLSSSLPALTTLNLAHNRLVGGLPAFKNTPNLQYLNLSLNQLSGSVPASMKGMQKLETLDLSGNQLYGLILSSVSQLPSLNFLNISNNQLSGILSDNIAAFSNVTVFDVSHNTISGVISPFIKQLVNVTYLDLSSNLIVGGIPSEIGSLSLMTHLDLGNNGLSGDIPDSLYTLSALTSVSLSGNQFSGSISPQFWTMSALSYLDLSSNSYNGPIPDISSSKRSISLMKHLDLSNNHLVGTIPSGISNMDNLLHLNLSLNRLSGGIVSPLTTLSRLQVLDLHGNPLGGTIPSNIGIMSSIQQRESWSWLEFLIPSVILSNNQLTGSIPDSLSTLHSMTTLALDNNELSGVLPETMYTGLVVLSSCVLAPQGNGSYFTCTKILAVCNITGNPCKTSTVTDSNQGGNGFKDIANAFSKCGTGCIIGVSCGAGVVIIAIIVVTIVMKRRAKLRSRISAKKNGMLPSMEKLNWFAEAVGVTGAPRPNTNKTEQAIPPTPEQPAEPAPATTRSGAHTSRPPTNRSLVMTEEELKEQPTQEDVHEEPNRQHVQPGEPEGSLEQDGLTERQP